MGILVYVADIAAPFSFPQAREWRWSDSVLVVMTPENRRSWDGGDPQEGDFELVDSAEKRTLASFPREQVKAVVRLDEAIPFSIPGLAPRVPAPEQPTEPFMAPQRFTDETVYARPEVGTPAFAGRVMRPRPRAAQEGLSQRGS